MTFHLLFSLGGPPLGEKSFFKFSGQLSISFRFAGRALRAAICINPHRIFLRTSIFQEVN